VYKNLKIGLLFTGIGKFSNLLISLVVNAILSRVLSPSDYGIVAIIQVFIIFFQLLVEAGMGPAIIQNKNLTKNDISALFNYSILIALLLSLGFGFFGYALKLAYNNPIFIHLSWIQSIAIFFNGINVVPTAIMNKDKMFKQLNIVQVFGNLCGGSIGIIFAFNGYGVYSLIFNAITLSIITFLFNFYLSKVKIGINFNVKPLKDIFSFSINQFGFNFINYFSRNTDNILVGRFLGSAALGNYNKAYQLLMMPNNLLLGIINPVLQPVFSDYQNEVKLIKKTYLSIIHFLALVGCPLSVFLSIFSEDIIFFMFGNQWQDAVTPFKILSLTVWIQMTLSSTEPFSKQEINLKS